MDLNQLLQRYDVPGPRYTSYPTVPEWTTDFSSDDYAARLEQAGRKPGEPLSLYFHLPFCKSLCWYCGCNVVISKDPAAADRYIDHLIKEMDLARGKLGRRTRVSQLHWGGGTPTFLTELQIARLGYAITDRFGLTDDAEVSIEIHPAVTTPGQLTLLRRLGFNRISMGLQDFDPKVQEATNRIQTFEQTRALLEHARTLGFSGINFDLIYGLPFQNAERWEKTLEKVLELRPDRLAVYSFAFMPEVLKHQKRMPANELPRASDKLGLFRRARECFLAAGYVPIGMDHFALPEDELARAQRERRLGRNFQGYTVSAANDVVAFGASAISDVSGAYAQNVRQLSKYYERISRGRFATERGVVLTEDDVVRRRLIQQVMCNFWADLGSPQAFGPERERLRPLEKDGLVRIDGRDLEVTPLGQFFVRNVAMAFDARLWASGKARFSRTV